jgi:virginiamycin B lyase
MFDTKTERFQEWEMSAPFNWPYDVVLDKNGYAWTAGMISDRVTRLNSKTGEMVDYLLPRFSNIRNVNVDDSTNLPTFWVGSNDGASIIKLEALE